MYAQSEEKINLNETHSVILSFSSEIRYVDFGIGEIVGERLNSPGMLKLQSSKPYFKESTITIVTSDGGFHQFVVNYSDVIDRYVWQQSGKAYAVDSVGLSTVMTTHFICDEKITDIVLSSSSIIAEHADRIENIVKAKALDATFNETNIHLITSSGYIYTFNIKPEETPHRLSVLLSSEDEETQSSQAIFNSNSINENQMKVIADMLINERPLINDIGVVDLKMAFAVSGIYSYNDLLAFKLDVTNNGEIDYSVDFVKGYIRDKSDSKTSAMQEEELYPVFTYYSEKLHPDILPSGSSETIVLFYQKFTIPHKRILHFEIFEKNGGRHLSFPISSKEVLKAKKLQ